MTDFKLKGPYRTGLNIIMVNDKTGAIAEAEWIVWGEIPGEEKTAEIIQECVAETVKQTGNPEWRAATKRELFDHMLSEAGVPGDMKFAMPGGEEWDA